MSSRVQLAGSERRHPSNSELAGQPSSDRNIEITLVLRRKPDSAAPRTQRRVSRASFAAVLGADPADVQAVYAFAAAHQFSVLDVRPAARTIRLGGPLGKWQELFQADLRLSCIDGEIYRTRQGDLQVPAELAGIVNAVLGFDERPAAGTNHFFRKKRASTATAYTPIELAKLYNFPPSTGKGQTIALIELGGGYTEEDLRAYWTKLGLPAVSVSAVGIDGAQNSPNGDPNGADGEVTLDIQVAGAVASGANIAVYFAPNTDAGFLNAINAAIHDTVRKPSVISISWGAAEVEWTAQSKNVMNAAFQDAALLGISVFVAAGDGGSSDGEQDHKKHVDFPASSPWVTACGGTRLIAANGAIESETVWNDGALAGSTGGGVSSFFSKPAYQAKVKVPKPAGTTNSNGRGLPDVAAVADPQTGYRVFVAGQDAVIGGTSAVAPLWAALTALCNEQLGKPLGWLNPILYGTIAQNKVLHDITSGTNGAYRASKTWDCCTGLGTPNGQAMLDLFKKG